MKALVTGGAGFIGSNIGERYLSSFVVGEKDLAKYNPKVFAQKEHLRRHPVEIAEIINMANGKRKVLFGSDFSLEDWIKIEKFYTNHKQYKIWID